ncbi:MAG TPA: pyruvate formate-lyase-activating protein [Actinomycetales bacterium]|nr:pyruvate formate-lyase-activating protein [Actinomycetales bacterium]
MATTAAPATGTQERASTFAAMRAGDIGSVHSWELVTAVDGPGTRMTLFLAGCVLRCKFCHNPDTWKMRDGATHTVDEVMQRIVRYTQVFRATGGGVTLSGGEPLMQPAFVAQIFRRCKELGIHTTLDTSGYLGARASDELLADTDLVLLDVKSGDPDTYKNITGVKLEPTLAFGRRLAAAQKRIWLRFVLVPGLSDDFDNVEAVAEYAASLGSVERVEVLPFHQMGREKWQRLGLKYELEDTEPPSAELIARVHEQFRSRGLTVY